MSDNKKYYYLKLKDNYFDQDNIKVLESMKNGHIYSLIILKLYVKSSKYDGKLMMTHEIPYKPDNVDILANVINHDIDHVKEAIKKGIQLGLITLLNTKEFWMTEIQNFIGHSSTEADRIREYRNKIGCTNVQQMNDKSTPELKIDKEIELDIKKNDVLKKWNNFSKEHNISTMKQLTNKRYDKYKTRFDEGMRLKDIFDKIIASDFLQGKSDRGWKLTFDWLIENDTNWVKVMEDRYTDSDPEMDKINKMIDDAQRAGIA